MVDVRLLRAPVAPADWSSLGPFPAECGAECVFLGRTRADRSAVHGELVRLEYEAYEAMALALLESLATHAVDCLGCRAVRLLHALGPVAVGEASVLVQVVTPHRDASFVACRTLIDRLKAEAPIWKREVWADGATWSPGSVVMADTAAKGPAS